MRLWHKDLIRVLPRQQLLGQWRECCAIAKSIAGKGTPNHILVNRIMDYPLEHFYRYCGKVFYQFIDRGYKCDEHKVLCYVEHPFTDVFYNQKLRCDDALFHDWHNNSYFWQCFFNLEEKYDCGGISEEEWNKIVSGMNQYMSRGRNESVSCV